MCTTENALSLKKTYCFAEVVLAACENRFGLSSVNVQEKLNHAVIAVEVVREYEGVPCEQWLTIAIKHCEHTQSAGLKILAEDLEV